MHLFLVKHAGHPDRIAALGVLVNATVPVGRRRLWATVRERNAAFPALHTLAPLHAVGQRVAVT